MVLCLLDWVDDGRVVSHAGQHVDKSKSVFEQTRRKGKFGGGRIKKKGLKVQKVG
jgi:hypothetical protein